MHGIPKKLLHLMILLLFAGCINRNTITILVRNNSKIIRHSETVTIPLIDLKSLNVRDFSALAAKNTATGECRPTQLIDRDRDGQKDALIFQADAAPFSGARYQLIKVSDSGCKIDSSISTYSRFVPERIDDYAWENDRVAFRMYGPEAQRLAQENNPEGIMSSGIDCWYKRVSYPIINKWYKKATDKTGSYHEDTGEGLDEYNVGSSRGCGGIGVWKDDSLYVSQNFTEHHTWETGPVRTSFELKYAPWNGGDIQISEKKEISLDLGSNLSRVEIDFDAPYPERIVAGLALEPQKGIIKTDEKSGWFSYEMPQSDSEACFGIVADPKYVAGMEQFRSDLPEKSHLFVFLRPIDGKVVYYTGFGWKKSGQFASGSEWENYLANFAARLASPLEVEIKD